MNPSNPIIDHVENPHVLENMYRQDPKAFKKNLDEALITNDASPVLQVWRERLYYKEPDQVKIARKKKDFFLMLLFSMIGGLIGRILLQGAIHERIHPLNLVFLVFLLLNAYLLIRNPPGKWLISLVSALFLLTGWYFNMLPMEHYDTSILAYLHLPVLWWILTGLSFCGDSWKNQRDRVIYLKFSVEFILLYAGFALFGIIGTGLTLPLFEMLGMNIEVFYFENIVVFGAVSLSVVSAYLVMKYRGFSDNILSVLAKIFSPLILLTLLVFAFAIVTSGNNPFANRDFLLIFNGVLLFVLAVSLFFLLEITPERKKSILDDLHTALILLTLVFDVAALLAIVFRLNVYGITANRLAVLGLNIVVGIHLTWIMGASWKNKRSPEFFSARSDAATRYLPVYGFWSAIVVFLFPILFPY